jgi:hypothetical protein
MIEVYYVVRDSSGAYLAGDTWSLDVREAVTFRSIEEIYHDCNNPDYKTNGMLDEHHQYEIKTLFTA